MAVNSIQILRALRENKANKKQMSKAKKKKVLQDLKKKIKK
jgi:hypothetical protein